MRIGRIVVIVLMLAGCRQDLLGQHHSIIDWMNFIKFGGITYTADYTEAGRDLTQEDIGPEFAKVQFNVSKHVKDAQYKTKDGDAAFLDEGTPVYTVKGYRPEFRLAAQWNGKWIAYEADTNPYASKGADLLDLAGKVEYIGVNGEQDGKTELAAIRDAGKVAALVQAALDAPVAESNADKAGESGERYFIAFHLKDGTAVIRPFWPGTGELWRNIMLPPSFADAVRKAVEESRGSKPGGTDAVGPNAGDPPSDDPAGAGDTGKKELPVMDEANQVVQALKAKDVVVLSAFADPEQGIRFSPYGHVDVKKDLVFKADQLAKLGADGGKKYVWGSYDGSGKPIELTWSAYFDQFVYDQDFANAKEVSVNRILGKGNEENNQFEVYPRDKYEIVEYHFSGFDPKFKGADWRSLRLVFSLKEGHYRLAGIIHDQWTT